MNKVWRFAASVAVVAAATLGVQGAAQAQTQEYARVGGWTVLTEPQTPSSCRAYMENGALQEDFGRSFGVFLDGDAWQLWTDYRIYNEMRTAVLIDGRSYPATFDQIENVAVAPVGRNVIEAMKSGRSVNLNLDPTGPEYSLRNAGDALRMVEACVRSGGRRAGGHARHSQYSDPGIDWIRLSGGAIDRRAEPVGRDTNGAPLYVCAADFDGASQPGKIREGFSGCNFGYGGSEMTSATYALMLGRANWAHASDGNVPSNAIQAGSERDGQALFVCRANYDGSVQLGKVRPGFDGCNFSYGGREYTANPYEVMY